MKFLFCYVSVLLSLNAWAQQPKGPDAATLERMGAHNRALADQEPLFRDLQAFGSVTPFAEYEESGYLFFNDDDYFGFARDIKNEIAATLPENATLVVYSTSTNNAHLLRLHERYSQFIDEERLIILQIPRSGSTDFWARDALPVPVWTEGEFTLVDARYYHNFEPSAFLAELFSSLKTKHEYFFEGGNFIANHLGDCIVVNRRRSYPGGVSDTAAIPDSIFEQHYGCERLTRLRHLKGIGHSDEVVKFMSESVVVTDTPEYVDILEAKGYKVHLLPDPPGRFETYINALQVNDVLYVPIFGHPFDDEALRIYGEIKPDLKLVPLNSRALSGRGQGGIHCITKNYPPVPMSKLLDELQARLWEKGQVAE